VNCSQQLLEAYLDEELDAGRQAAVGQHLAACGDCSRAFARLRQQKADIKAAAPYYSTPPRLGQAVRNALECAAAQEAKPPVREERWRWLAIAASLLLIPSLSWNLLHLRPEPAAEGDLAKSVLTDHVRSLLATRLVDVAASDQHTVKPWFPGKVDFAPKVKDLDAQGFPLAGGRVDYLADRRVAAVVYYRRRHVINLFTWPDGSPALSDAGISRDGYNLLHWTDGSMTYWAVSDVSPGELERFRNLYR
jgi:anti-sigma factor RsiW